MIVVAVLVTLVITTAAIESALDLLNMAEARRSAASPPDFVLDRMDRATYERSVAYSLAKGRLGLVVRTLDALLKIALLATPLLAWSYDLVASQWGVGIWGQTGYLCLFAVASALVHLPFGYWAQFGLEQRFGFNRSGPGLFFLDQAKGFALAAALLVPLTALILWLIRTMGFWWWMGGFFVVTGVQAFLAAVFPRFILPLFNKLTPLPDGSLRARLLDLARRTNFGVASIHVMDGSKRSTHSNAFFAGMGKLRRIVLFDTLVSGATEAELESVLAHEIGHSKLGHIRKSLLFGAASTLATFGVAGWLLRAGWFMRAFDLPQDAEGPALLLIVLVLGMMGFWFTPLGSWLSRKHEYEADAFARVATGSPDSLIAALRKLTRANLSNLTPHPWFVWFYYSHPTVMQREAALRSQ